MMLLCQELICEISILWKVISALRAPADGGEDAHAGTTGWTTGIVERRKRSIDQGGDCRLDLPQ
jgi:hypothetical protein